MAYGRGAVCGVGVKTTLGSSSSWRGLEGGGGGLRNAGSRVRRYGAVGGLGRRGAWGCEGEEGARGRPWARVEL